MRRLLTKFCVRRDPDQQFAAFYIYLSQIQKILGLTPYTNE